jgi:hypothetical protein
MIWMEIIRIRAGVSCAEVSTEIMAWVSNLKQGGMTEARVYRHAFLESDLSIHLHWETAVVNSNGSTASLHLVRALGDFGLIDHTTWIPVTGAADE